MATEPRQVIGIDLGVEGGDQTWLMWDCPECGTRVSSRYLPGFESGLLRDAFMVLARLRDDEVDDFARRLVEADARASQPWLPIARAATEERD